MFSTPLPFFLKKSLLKDDNLRYFNSFCVQNDYPTLLNHKKSNIFNTISPDQASNQCINVNCKALFTPKYLKSGSNLHWKCPFCSLENKLNNNQNCLNFPINVYFPQKKIENPWEKKLLFIICLDYSGSMNCTYFPMSQKANLENLLNNGRTFDDLETNHLISRKNLVISALEGFFDNLLMYSQAFDIRVFMILFNNEVKLLGDCRKSPEVLSGNSLMNLEECLNKGRFSAENLCSSRFDAFSKKRILNTLKSIDPDDTTALGPAIAAGFGIMETFVRNQDFHNCSFYVFTDGKSNIGKGNLDVLDKTEKNIIDDKIYKDSVSFYENLNELALNYYPQFHFVTFEDQVTMTKVFKNRLMKRLNGNLFQIKVLQENIKMKSYKFYDDLGLEEYMSHVSNNLFKGKLVQLTIYQSPGSEMKFFKKNYVYIEKNTNNLIMKKPCYMEGEPFIGVYSEYKEEIEKKQKFDFQIKLEFFSLNESLSEVFISSFNQEFCSEDGLNQYLKKGKEICQKETVKFLIKLQGKMKKDPTTFEKKYLGIIETLKKYMKKLEIPGQIVEENENEDIIREKEEEEEEKTAIDKEKETSHGFSHLEKKPNEEDPSDDSDEDLADDKKTSLNFHEEKKESRTLTMTNEGKFEKNSNEIHEKKIEEKTDEEEEEEEKKLKNQKNDRDKDTSENFLHKENTTNTDEEDMEFKVISIGIKDQSQNLLFQEKNHKKSYEEEEEEEDEEEEELDDAKEIKGNKKTEGNFHQENKQSRTFNL